MGLNHLNPFAQRPDPTRPLPVRFTPAPDELLSSWLTRIIWKLGLDPSQCSPDILGATSVRQRDLHVPRRLAMAVAAATALPAAGIAGLRLSKPPDTVRAGGIVSHPEQIVAAVSVPLGLMVDSSAWVLPKTRRSSGAGRSQPLCFCPACLAEDEEPYFRRAWRLAFPTTCMRHGLVLQDSCPICGAEVAPWRIRRSRLENPTVGVDLARCWRCLGDLRRADRQIAMHDVYVMEQRVLMTWTLARHRQSNALGFLHDPCFNVAIELFIGQVLKRPRPLRAFRYLDPRLRYETELCCLRQLSSAIEEMHSTDWKVAGGLIAMSNPLPQLERRPVWAYQPTEKSAGSRDQPTQHLRL